MDHKVYKHTERRKKLCITVSIKTVIHEKYSKICFKNVICSLLCVKKIRKHLKSDV